MLKQLRVAAAVATALIACAGQAEAASLSFAGTFTQDDNLAILNFAVTSPGNVTIETFSYAGGTDPVRGAIAAGGFDTVFGLFNSAGALLAIGDDGATRADPVTGAAFDALLTTNLSTGNYFVALAEYDNYPNGPTFADGFLESGKGNFTAQFGCSNGKFCDVNAFNRTGAYDLAITGGVAAVPEPSMFALMSAGLVGMAGIARRRLAAKTKAQQIC